MKFEDKLIKLRKKNLLSQEELAEKLNVTRQTISKWELGQSAPDMVKLREISQIFEVGIEELVNDNLEVAEKEKNKSKQKNGRKWLLWLFVVILLASTITLVIRIGLQREKDNEKGFFGNVFNQIGSTYLSNKYTFGHLQGLKSGWDIKDDFDKIITNNKLEGYVSIAVVYNGKVAKTEQEILDIKNQIPNNSLKVYNISLDYADSRGMAVNKITITKIVESASSFNSGIKEIEGTQSSTFLDNYIDKVITKNQTNDVRKITIQFEGKDYITEQEISSLKLKHEMFTDYVCSLEYDEDGYINKIIIRISPKSFNSRIESIQGTTWGAAMYSELDEVIKRNKAYSDNAITITYKGASYKTEEEIVALKRKLGTSPDYEVSLTYDEEGYIDKIIIKRI